MTTSTNVVRRFLSRYINADDAFRPPKSIVNAVDTGVLDPHVLLFWKGVVDNIAASPRGWSGSSGCYSAAVAYWRSKCAKNGYPLPNEYIVGLGGKGSQGRWSVKAGDEIEEWVKQTLMSQGLIEAVARTAAEWKMEIVHLERELSEAKVRVEKNTAALAKARSDKGAAQKKKWLEDAMRDVTKFEGDLKNAHKQLEDLEQAVAKNEKVNSYSIEFEKELQFMLMIAAKDLDKKHVLESVKKALERFEQGVEIPGEQVEPQVQQVRTYTAGILDVISGVLVKAWNHLKGAFDLFTDWLLGLDDATKKLDKLLSEGGAG